MCTISELSFVKGFLLSYYRLTHCVILQSAIKLNVESIWTSIERSLSTSAVQSVLQRQKCVVAVEQLKDESPRVGKQGSDHRRPTGWSYTSDGPAWWCWCVSESIECHVLHVHRGFLMIRASRVCCMNCNSCCASQNWGWKPTSNTVVWATAIWALYEEVLDNLGVIILFVKMKVLS